MIPILRFKRPLHHLNVSDPKLPMRLLPIQFMQGGTIQRPQLEGFLSTEIHPPSDFGPKHYEIIQRSLRFFSDKNGRGSGIRTHIELSLLPASKAGVKPLDFTPIKMAPVTRFDQVSYSSSANRADHLHQTGIKFGGCGRI